MKNTRTISGTAFCRQPPASTPAAGSFFGSVRTLLGRGLWRMAVWGALAMPLTIQAATPGEKLWDFPVGTSVQSSPAIGQDGTIYFGADNGAVYALSPEGKKKWEFRAAASVAASPAVAADGAIYVVSTDRIVYALNPDGTERWRLMPGAGLVSSPAIGPDGTIYVGEVFGKFYAIDPQGFKKWDFPCGGNIISSPAVGADGVVYFGCWDTNFYAVKPDGSRKWMFLTEDRIHSSPAIGPGGTIYFGCFDKYLYALSPEGDRLWDFLTGNAIRGSPAVDRDGVVYCGSDDQKLYAILPDGKKKWEFATEGVVRSTPAIGADGTIYVASYDHRLYALKPDGAKKWQFAAGGPLSSSPVIDPQGVIYFGGWDGVFYAVQGEGPPARESWPMFHRDPQRSGAVAKGAAPIVSRVVPTLPRQTPPPVIEEPGIVLPPVTQPTFTNRVAVPPVRFTDITATPRDLILSNETIFLKPPPLPERPSLERIRNDKTSPKLVVKSPDEKARFTNPLLIVEGIARDNEGLDRVEYSFNGGNVRAADGVGDWTIRLHMRPGENQLMLRAVDLAGNGSDWETLSYRYLISSPLLIQINGEGDISPNLAGQYLEIGKTYQLAAKPGRGFVFSGWTGGLKSPQPKLEFVMRSNLVLTANFERKEPIVRTVPPKPAPPSVPPSVPPAEKPALKVAIQVVGGGDVKSDSNLRKTLDSGVVLHLAAVPDKGHVFAGWRGAIQNPSPEIAFVVTSNMNLTAEFVQGPFTISPGSYQGLVWDPNGVSHERSGLLSFDLDANGRYRGKLLYGGDSFALNGELAEDGAGQNLVLRKDQPSLRVNLACDTNSPVGRFKAAIQEAQSSLNLDCDRLVFDGRTVLAPASGKYTVILAGLGSASGSGLGGDGFAAVEVDKAGRVVLKGQLCDGSKLDVDAALLPDGRCPIWTPLYGGRGSLSGHLRFGPDDRGLDIAGQLAWFKPANPRDKYYPQGFSQLLGVAGSRYESPGRHQPLMTYTNVVLAFKGGNLADVMGNLLTLDDRNKAKTVYAGDKRFYCDINLSTGLFRGVFVHPVSEKTTEYEGALLPKLGWGSGHFLGPDRSGLVHFSAFVPEPPPPDGGQ